jgi:hypothetical protein
VKGLVVLAIVAAAIIVPSASSRSESCYGGCVSLSQKAQARHAIEATFGAYASQAVRVASCESGLSVRASNGQYLGLFQMGSYARSRYGHGPGPWAQSRAAFNYFAASGHDWSPWSCKPW